MTITSARAEVPGGAVPVHRRLAVGAVAGPVLFTAAWLVLGFVSSGYTLFDHTFTDYSPVSQPISGLGMGATAGYMNTAFVVTGLILIAGVVGVFRATGDPERSVLRRAALVLLAATGAGQIVCGVFDLEAVMPHMLGFLLALGTPVVGFPVAGRYFRTIPGWRRFGTWLMLGGPLTLALLIAFFATFQPTADGAEHGVAGLVQRIGVLEVHAWYVAMGLLALRRHHGRPHE
ncbi:Protein of unknown function [Thermomonospora echinospora]|uniref:DUF998 domain-containing protein n=1 Tax=Thermomonospora echinospora TaxID=1992 RepID=A0A1H6CZJ5_9ACTN|nr:DUF998 domain-containing protein [Thermomonospora echinospora]SEG78194.1 Protein of unknown function [Thermomonospora echinospora]